MDVCDVIDEQCLLIFLPSDVGSVDEMILEVTLISMSFTPPTQAAMHPRFCQKETPNKNPAPLAILHVGPSLASISSAIATWSLPPATCLPSRLLFWSVFVPLGLYSSHCSSHCSDGFSIEIAQCSQISQMCSSHFPGYGVAANYSDLDEIVVCNIWVIYSLLRVISLETNCIRAIEKCIKWELYFCTYTTHIPNRWHKFYIFWKF